MEIIIFLTVSPESHRTAEENLGIEYLASNLKKTLKYEIKIINGWIEKLSNEEIVEKILNYKNVLAIGVSSYLTDIENVKELLKIMKKLKLSKYYFAGGYGPTFSPEEYLKIGFDIACIGESDLIIRSLINYFSGKAKKENIKSICYLENNKIKVIKRLSYGIKKFDNLKKLIQLRIS